MILFHGTPAKFGPRKATGKIDSKMQKSIGSRSRYLSTDPMEKWKFGSRKRRGILDPTFLP